MPRTIFLRLETPLRTLLSDIAAIFAARDIQTYAAGGFLRDALLEAPIRDVDLSIDADPREFGPALADAVDAHYFPLDEERRHVRIRLPTHDLHVDLLPLRGAIDEDLRERDYTIDAMAASLDEVAAGRIALIDPTGGLRDLRDGVVRLVSEEALLRDPLRLLRGVRLAAQLDFHIEPGTANLIRRHAALLGGAAAVERQREELMRIFATPRAAHGLRLMDQLGLLDLVLPDMAVTRGVEQPKEHHWDVLSHSFAAVASLDALLSDQEPPVEPWRQLWRDLWTQLEWWIGAREYFRQQIVLNTPRSAILKLAAFLHDIGKPQTKSFEPSGRMRFFGHSDAGAEIAERLMRRLRFSTREIALVRAMIEAHLRPVQMAQERAPTRRAIYRFFRDTGEAGIDTLFLSLADHLGTVGPRVTLEGWRGHVALIAFLTATAFQQTDVASPQKLVDGDDLMAALGLEPGPRLGQLLAVIHEAHAIGEITTKQEAIELARRHLGKIAS